MSALGDELRDCANELQLCIHEFREQCKGEWPDSPDTEAYRAMDTTGKPILAGMLVEYARVLMALAGLDEDLDPEDQAYASEARARDKAVEGSEEPEPMSSLDIMKMRSKWPGVGRDA